MKYRKKPVEVEAEVYKAGMEDGWLLVFENRIVDENPEGFAAKPIIKTLEGYHEISDGDYIITGVKGERYPCKPDIFEMTYDKVDPNEAQ